MNDKLGKNGKNGFTSAAAVLAPQDLDYLTTLSSVADTNHDIVGTLQVIAQEADPIRILPPLKLTARTNEAVVGLGRELVPYPTPS